MANQSDNSQLTICPSLHSRVEGSNVPEQEYGMSRSEHVFLVKGNHIQIDSLKHCS